MKLPIALTLLLTLTLSAAHADIIEVNPDDGTLSVDGGAFASSVTFRGVAIEAGGLVGSTREYRVLGDFNLLSGDRLTASRNTRNAVRFSAGNNINIDSGAVIDISASGSEGRAGGGAGGRGGTGGVASSSVGRGGTGGSGGNPAGNTRRGDRGNSGGRGGFGGTGTSGFQGGTGGVGAPGQSGVNNNIVQQETTGGAGGSGGASVQQRVAGGAKRFQHSIPKVHCSPRRQGLPSMHCLMLS